MDVKLRLVGDDCGLKRLRHSCSYTDIALSRPESELNSTCTVWRIYGLQLM